MTEFSMRMLPLAFVVASLLPLSARADDSSAALKAGGLVADEDGQGGPRVGGSVSPRKP